MSDESIEGIAPQSAWRPKVFGVGLMKTGTTSLGYCLAQFGYSHRTFYPKLLRQIRRGEWDPFWKTADQYESFDDHPWPDAYRELDARYADAKFILTVRRDSESWYRSMDKHAERMGPTAERRIIFGHGWPRTDKPAHIDYYETHNKAVVEHFADRPGKLMVVCWETGSTVQGVAEFLGIDAIPQSLETYKDRAPQLNTAQKQAFSVKYWTRNTLKYVVIGRLRIDPFRHRNFRP